MHLRRHGLAVLQSILYAYRKPTKERQSGENSFDSVCCDFPVCSGLAKQSVHFAVGLVRKFGRTERGNGVCFKRCVLVCGRSAFFPFCSHIHNLSLSKMQLLKVANFEEVNRKQSECKGMARWHVRTHAHTSHHTFIIAFPALHCRK